MLDLTAEAADGCDTVVLLGMGGSSLAPEVLRRAFGSVAFHVLDTTHPQAIRGLGEQLDLEHTLFVSASKSGSTLETRSHTDYFWRLAPRGEQWVAITDPGSELAALAQERKFAAVFVGEPTIGGRYSALSPFGLVPAALVGVDLARLLDRACEMADACRLDDGNPGLDLGLALGEGWRAGRDKVCLPNENGFGLWAEQLLAESTGKQGRGLVPAPGESPEGDDRQGARRPPARPVRARPGVLPLGVRDRRRRLDARHQPLRPAGRAGGQGPDEPGARGRRRRPRARVVARGALRARRGRRLRLHPGLRQPDRRRRRSAWRRSPSRRGARPAASSRTASGRATCTRRASCTRAARTPASSCRWSRTTAPSCRSRSGRSASAG